MVYGIHGKTLYKLSFLWVSKSDDIRDITWQFMVTIVYIKFQWLGLWVAWKCQFVTFCELGFITGLYDRDSTLPDTFACRPSLLCRNSAKPLKSLWDMRNSPFTSYYNPGFIMNHRKSNCSSNFTWILPFRIWRKSILLLSCRYKPSQTRRFSSILKKTPKFVWLRVLIFYRLGSTSVTIHSL